MKRKTLTRNLNRVINRIQTLNLPLIVDSFYIHGSYIRGDEEPGDLDLILTYSSRDDRDKLNEAFHDLRNIADDLHDHNNRGIMLRKAAIGPLKNSIENLGIPCEWLSTYSWARLFGRTAPYLAYKFWPTIITKSLLSKGMKGVHIEFTSEREFNHIFGNLYTYRNLVLYNLWNKNNPKVKNLELNKRELEKYLEIEHTNLRDQWKRYQVLVSALYYLLMGVLIYIPDSRFDEIKHRIYNSINKGLKLNDKITMLLTDFNIIRGINSSFNYEGVDVYDYEINQYGNKRLREDVKDLTDKIHIISELWRIISDSLSDNDLNTIIIQAKTNFEKNIDSKHITYYNNKPAPLNYSYYLRRPLTEMGLKIGMA